MFTIIGAREKPKVFPIIRWQGYSLDALGIHVRPRIPPMNIRREPMNKPHIVGNASKDAIRTRVDPVLILSRSEEFIQKIPIIDATITATDNPIHPAIQPPFRGRKKLVPRAPIIDIMPDHAFHIHKPMGTIKMAAKTWTPTPTTDNA